MEENQKIKANNNRKILLLWFLGFVITLIGIMILIATALFYGESSTNVGGVIFIWFIPIVFGAGPEAAWMVLFAIILTVLSFLMFLILKREAAKANA